MQMTQITANDGHRYEININTLHVNEDDTSSASYHFVTATRIDKPDEEFNPLDLLSDVTIIGRFDPAGLAGGQ